MLLIVVVVVIVKRRDCGTSSILYIQLLLAQSQQSARLVARMLSSKLSQATQVTILGSKPVRGACTGLGISRRRSRGILFGLSLSIPSLGTNGRTGQNDSRRRRRRRRRKRWIVIRGVSSCINIHTRLVHSSQDDNSTEVTKDQFLTTVFIGPMRKRLCPISNEQL
jgi:hypothetical protein